MYGYQRVSDLLPITIAALGAIIAASPAAATTIISSSAYGLSVDLSVTPLIDATIGPVAAVGGSAGAAYTDAATLASVNESLGLGTVTGVVPALTLRVAQSVGTGLITTTAASPYPSLPTGDASATVDNLALALTSKIGFTPATTLLGIGADVIRSTAAVDGTGAPTATGSTTITGLTLTGTALGALTIDGSLFVNPLPNTTLLNLLGLKIVLNEQLPRGDDVTAAGITTNSIHATFTNFLLGTGLLNGSIIISDSRADFSGGSVTQVPEPAIWLEMVAGFGVVGVVVRRRRTAVAA